MIHSVVCLMTGPHTYSKKAPHRVRSSAFLFSFPVSSLFLKAIQQLLMPSSSSSRHLYSSFFQKAVPEQNLTNPFSRPSFYLCSMFLSSFTLSNTSYSTRKVQLMYSIFLMHHILCISIQLQLNFGQIWKTQSLFLNENEGFFKPFFKRSSSLTRIFHFTIGTH